MNKLIYFKFLAVLLTSLWGIQQASAYDFAKDGIYYVINGTNAYVTYKDTNYNSYSGTVNIPSTVTNNGTTYNVVQINPYAFKNCANLKRVVLPPTINYLMNYAFQNCTGLTDITLPANFYSCYNYVFDGCTNLKSIICLSPTPHNWNANNLPSTVLSNATLIVPQGKKAAYESVSGCLSSFSDIQEMDCDFAEDAIFYKDLGDNKASVTHALRFAEDYSGDITIPQTVTHGGTTYTVTTVGSEAFYDCHNLYSVVLPQTVNSISNYAFYYCNNLTNVNIPEGVQYINYCTFGACASLQDIIIPSSVTWIAQKAFSNCQNLTNITCRATTPPTCDNTNSFPSQAYTNATLNVSSKALSAYQAANIWKNFTNIVEIDLPVEAKRGDVNGDGQVTISDVTALIDYLLGGGIISTEAADVNLDNGVSISDVTTLIDYLLGGQWPATGRLDLWYLIGDNVGSQPWENNGQNSVGRGLLPLYPVGEFDSNGKGRLQYTGYFGANEAVMLIHNPGRFDDCWGYTPTGVFGFGGEDITAVSTGNDGYYSIMMYNNPDRFYFIPYTASTPISFNSINIVGPHSNWDVTNSEYNMTPLNPGKENHNWIFRDFTTASDTEVKIAANNWWDYNWGVEQFPWGRGERNGNNIPVEAGTYDVYFNDITGDFHFIKK